MPISQENRALYPPDWPALSKRIRFVRAGGKCEQCGVKHGAILWTDSQGVRREVGGAEADALLLDGQRTARVVLTVAHLNHDPRDNREENLKALCQQCHNRLDVEHRKLSRALLRDKRRGQGRLFEMRERENRQDAKDAKQ